MNVGKVCMLLVFGRYNTLGTHLRDAATVFIPYAVASCLQFLP
jgi:hypothetical protein